MSDIQTEVISKLSELSAQIRELVIELRHTQRSHETHETRIQKLEDGIEKLKLENALNKPILDIARAINTKMWFTIIGSMSAIGAAAVYGQKMTGG